MSAGMRDIAMATDHGRCPSVREPSVCRK
jgi:hypothetical protein